MRTRTGPLGSQRRSAAARRLLTGLMTLALLGPLAVWAGSATAQAATCTSWHSQTITGDVSKVSFKFSVDCSDGLAHVSGTVYDTKCDARQAQALVDFEVWPETGGTIEVWTKYAHVDGGCGNNSTFTGSGENPLGEVFSGDEWAVGGCTWAQNSTGKSSYVCGPFITGTT